MLEDNREQRNREAGKSESMVTHPGRRGFFIVVFLKVSVRQRCILFRVMIGKPGVARQSRPGEIYGSVMEEI